MTYRIASLTLAFAVACSAPELDEIVRLDAPAQVSSELAVPTEAEASITNLDPNWDLVVGEIRFEPDVDDVRWFGEGPWTLEPGVTRPFRIFWKPEAEGRFSTRIFVVTDAGELSQALTLVGTTPVDQDGDGYSVAQGDCDDTDADVGPDAPEICNGVDDNCNDEIDDGFDADRDGFLDRASCPEELGPLDCNDNDRTTFPGAVEECDGSDSDCNGTVDDIDEPAALQLGVCEGALKRCTAGGPVEPEYYRIDGYEALEYSCDGLDNDCDGKADDFDRLGEGGLDCVDDDGDGFTEIEGDCDDTDRRILPSDCGPDTLVVTSNEEGFATVDLNTGAVVRVATAGVRTFQGAVVDDAIWFAARDDARLVRYGLTDGSVLISSRFERSPTAVGKDVASGDLLVLYVDGGLQRRDPDTGSFKSEVTLAEAKPTAWTPLPDGSFWTCTADGLLLRVDITGELSRTDIGAACYGAPAVRGDRVVLPAYEAGTIIEIDGRTLEQVRARGTRKPAVRALWVGDDLWTTSAVDRTVEIFQGGDLLWKAYVELGGQTQGLWYDDVRELVWVAVFGSDELVAIDRRTLVVRTRLPIPQPVDVFPLPKE